MLTRCRILTSAGSIPARFLRRNSATVCILISSYILLNLLISVLGDRKGNTALALQSRQYGFAIRRATFKLADIQ